MPRRDLDPGISTGTPDDAVALFQRHDLVGDRFVPPARHGEHQARLARARGSHHDRDRAAHRDGAAVKHRESAPGKV